jgi:hypothetical protein
MTLSLTLRKKPNVQALPRVARLVIQLEPIVYMGKVGLSASMSMFTLINNPLSRLLTICRALKLNHTFVSLLCDIRDRLSDEDRQKVQDVLEIVGSRFHNAASLVWWRR